MSPQRWFVLLTLALALPLVQAQEPVGGGSGDPPFDPGGLLGDEPVIEPAAPPEPPAPLIDASTPDFKAALELQRKGKWSAAQKALRSVLDKFPNSVHKKSIEEHSDDNAYLGLEVFHRSGPKERRIDVAVMGDGFTIDTEDQNLELKWAKLCLEVLCNEYAFDEYRDYFNFYFVRLASLEEGVDPQLSPEEKAKIEERNKSRTRKKKTDFSTALDCKAAGPQGQVLADRRLVYKWLKIAAKEDAGCQDDGLIIAFARFGQLGMGGGGIANVGRPDKSVTVHEFGHSFVGLLDEYTNNPTTPQYKIEAPNASMTPDPKLVPWAHILEKKVAGVGVFEGGATYFKGVWRPSRSCAMNSAGHTGYCPVCREAAILKIYSYVNPIDSFDPPATNEVNVKEGDDKAYLSVTPMKPKKHELKTTWYVEPVQTDAPGPVAAGSGRTGEAKSDEFRNRMQEALTGRWGRNAKRERENRITYDIPPGGNIDTTGMTKKGDAGKAAQCVFPIGRLKPGRYRITAVVVDGTGYVYKDAKHLLEERVSWLVRVAPRG